MKNKKYKEAKELSTVILNKKDDSTAFAVQIFLKIEDTALKELISELPITITSSTTSYQIFKKRLAGFLIDANKPNLLNTLFEDDIVESNFPEKITFQNKGYWLLLSNVKIVQAIHKGWLLFKKARIRKKPHQELLTAIRFMEGILDSLKNTEHYENIYHHRFYLIYGKYIAYGEKTDALELNKLFLKIPFKKQDQYLFQICSILNQEEKYSEVLNLLDDKTSILPQFHYIKSLAFQSIGQYDLSLNAMEEYFFAMPKIEHDCLHHFLYYLTICQEGERKRKVFESLKNQNKFGISPAEQLATIGVLWGTIKREELVKILDEAAEVVNEESNRFYFLIIGDNYFTLKEYIKSYDFLKTFVDFDKELPEHELCIQALNAYKEKDKKLLEHLENWRQKGLTLRPDFLSWEIDILSVIPDYIQMEEVAKLGFSNFPDSPIFLYYLILALHKQKKESEVQLLLDKTEKNKEFNQDIAFRLARIAIENKQFEVALRLTYSFAFNKENIKARESYLYIFSLLDIPGFSFIKPNLVAIDTVVLVKKEEEKEFVNITKTTVYNHPYANLLLQKSKGDTVVWNKQSFGEKNAIEIVEIFDKYEGLLIQISKEVYEGNTPSYVFQKIDLENDSFEEFNRQAKKVLGPIGSQQEIIKEDIFDRYQKREIAFSQLVMTLGSFPLDIYFQLTNSGGKGLNIIPKFHFQNRSFSKEAIFLLDFSTIALFFDLYDTYKIRFEKLFMISQFAIEIVEEELLQVKYSRSSNIALKITAESVNPTFYPKNFKQKRIDYLQRLAEWLRNQCITRPVREKIDLVQQLRLKQGKEPKLPYFDFYLDTFFLAKRENTCLVTDDLSLIGYLGQESSYNSSEFFLENVKPSEFNDKILPYLLKANYQGVTVNHSVLIKELEKYLLNKPNGYLNGIKQLSVQISFDNNGVNKAIDLVKHIYTQTGLLLQRKNLLSQQVLNFALDSIPRNREKLDLIQEIILLSFRFFPNFGMEAMNDLRLIWSKRI